MLSWPNIIRHCSVAAVPNHLAGVVPHRGKPPFEERLLLLRAFVATPEASAGYDPRMLRIANVTLNRYRKNLDNGTADQLVIDADKLRRNLARLMEEGARSDTTKRIDDAVTTFVLANE